MRYIRYAVFPLLILATSCQSTPDQINDVQSAQNADAHLTLGTIESHMHNGMSGSEVIDLFGPPNIVTTDDQHRETWVYDRISTMRAHTQSGGWATILLLGVGNQSNTSSTSQRTLTMIVKFDNQKRVRDYSYRYSNF